MEPTVAEIRAAMAKADEAALWKMLEDEKSNQARMYLMDILYAKASKARTQRERSDMMRAAMSKR
jgi:hypothetical protein